MKGCEFLYRNQPEYSIDFANRGFLIRYNHLDESHDTMQKRQKDSSDFDERLKIKIDSFLYGDKDFIYKNDIAKVWQDYITTADKGAPALVK